ncbi:hypothetical protein DH2020_037227 [Rehmannia glutinosa]|uniref:TF-B3 domain-containing protein n=1 Tax=Rehmannia glutinosa TaxID=99300 RepID=A0ABR0V3K7_REHGL
MTRQCDEVLFNLIPLISRKYRLNLPENITLRISSGKTWNVKLEKMENNDHWFTNGWSKFAQDVKLGHGEFMVFYLIGQSIFNVTIYGQTCCIREIPDDRLIKVEDNDADHVRLSQINLNAHDAIDNEPPKTSNDGASTSGGRALGTQNSPLYFEIVLKPHHKARVSLRKEFAVAAGLTGQESAGLEYLPTKRYQSVVLDQRSAYRLDMSIGWNNFRKTNGMVYGRRYSFEYNPGKNVIEVQEMNV